MVNEALIRNRISDPIDFTVADATAIAKGALLALTDERTAILSSSVAQPLAGIAAREKVASDGRTNLAVYYDGVFDMVASGAIRIGAWVVSGTTGSLNYVEEAKIFTSGGSTYATASGAQLLGYSLGTAADNEIVQIMVHVGR